MPGPDRLVGDNAVDAAADLDRTEVRRGARKLRLRGATLRLRLADASRLRRDTTTGGEVGSGLIGHSQKMTVAARATAEKKTVGQRS